MKISGCNSTIWFPPYTIRIAISLPFTVNRASCRLRMYFKALLKENMKDSIRQTVSHSLIIP